jgi:hypothetical protein
MNSLKKQPLYARRTPGRDFGKQILDRSGPHCFEKSRAIFIAMNVITGEQCLIREDRVCY